MGRPFFILLRVDVGIRKILDVGIDSLYIFLEVLDRRRYLSQSYNLGFQTSKVIRASQN